MSIESKDGSWIKVETVDGVITYTDSDGVWLKEKNYKKGVRG